MAQLCSARHQRPPARAWRAQVRGFQRDTRCMPCMHAAHTPGVSHQAAHAQDWPRVPQRHWAACCSANNGAIPGGCDGISRVRPTFLSVWRSHRLLPRFCCRTVCTCQPCSCRHQRCCQSLWTTRGGTGALAPSCWTATHAKESPGAAQGQEQAPLLLAPPSEACPLIWRRSCARVMQTSSRQSVSRLAAWCSKGRHTCTYTPAITQQTTAGQLTPALLAAGTQPSGNCGECGACSAGLGASLCLYQRRHGQGCGRCADRSPEPFHHQVLLHLWLCCAACVCLVRAP